jgi:hypothetical protein
VRPAGAGLEDRCWGNPDLTALIEPVLPKDPAAHPMLPAGQTFEIYMEGSLEVPFTRDEPLVVVERSQYCGLASVVFREQGEPPVKP